MSRNVLLATCRHRPSLTPSDELVATHLRSLGAAVTALPWDDIVPGGVGDTTICLRSTWDYHRRSTEFRAWVSTLRARAARLFNPAETVLWNMDKEYLGWLANHGVAIPETRWIAPGDPIDLPGLFAATAWDRAVLKPRISATAYGTHLVSGATMLDDEQRAALSRSGALLQAFVPEIQSAGEMSLVFIDSSFSHAVLKEPSRGDFRVQSEFGGTARAVDAPASLRAFGTAVLAAIPVPWTYARVDLVDTLRGPVLMELELIEPDLFLLSAPAAAARLANALVRAHPRSEG